MRSMPVWANPTDVLRRHQCDNVAEAALGSVRIGESQAKSQLYSNWQAARVLNEI